MKNYQLAPKEVFREQGFVILKTAQGDIPAEIVLTDMNFIFITEKKKLFSRKMRTCTTVFSKDLVKTYKDAPQIKQTDTSVKICFTKEERTIVFENKKDARTFTIKAWETVTGKNQFERSIDKLKYAIEYVDEALDINIATLIKESVKTGVSHAISSKITKRLNSKRDK